MISNILWYTVATWWPASQGPSCSQTQVYFTNKGELVMNPSKELKRKDFLSEPDEAVSDHFMAGYKASIDTIA